LEPADNCRIRTGLLTIRISSEGMMKEKTDLLLGAHMSIEGGLHKAFGRGEALGCKVIQIFTRNASRWKVKPLMENQVSLFKSEQERTGIMTLAHDSYLINLGSPKPGLFRQSTKAFRVEMDRSEQLGIPYLVMHPGAHTGSGEEAGLKSIIRALNGLLGDTQGYGLEILVENTAGQGSALGYSFEHLGQILSEAEYPERMGVCFDTCHAFAAGYDLRNRASYEKVMDDFDRIIGLDRIKALHLNDSRKGLGMRVDRHEHIGKGMLGMECFKLIMEDARFRQIPKLIETPKDLDGRDMDDVNLAILREMGDF